MLERSYPQLVLLTLTVAFIMTVGVVAGTSTTSFGAYNTNWDGTSEIRGAADAAGTETTIGQNVTAYERVAPTDTVAVVLSPDSTYGTETAPIRSYVRAGGTLIVADDFGAGGNEVLAAVGATARVNGTALRDEQQAGPSPAFPRATTDATQTYTDGVDEVMLNHGTAVEPGTARPIATSSVYSYLDTAPNEALDANETLAERPVITVEAVGNGTVVVVSDPSIFINAMLDRSDNRQFLQNIVTGHQRVLLDVSHQSAVPPLVAMQLFFQRAGLAILVIGGASVLAVIAVLNPPAVPSRLQRLIPWTRQSQRDETRPPVRSNDIAATIRARHPDWDDDRVERVTERLAERRQHSNK